MSVETVLDLLDGEARTKVKNLIKNDTALILIADDGIYIYNAKVLIIKISVTYYLKHRGL